MCFLFCGEDDVLSPEELVLDIQICPKMEYLLIVSLDYISLWKSSQKRSFLSKYTMNSDQINKYGMFQQCSWIGECSVAVLTSRGSILYFSFDTTNFFIGIHHSKVSLCDDFVTSIARFESTIVAATDSGKLFVIYGNSSNSYPLLDKPIKKISISGMNGLALAADGTVYSFLIKNNISPITCIRKIYQSAVTINITNGIGSMVDPKGFLFVTNFAGYEFKTKIKPTYSSVIIWVKSVAYMIIIYPDGSCYYWYYGTLMCRRYSMAQLKSCKSAVYSNGHIVASSSRGLVDLSICMISRHSPSFFGPLDYSIITFDQNSVNQKKFSIPYHEHPEFHNIDYLSYNESIESTVMASRNCVIYHSIRQNKWENLDINGLYPRGVTWMKSYICVLAFNKVSLEYRLVWISGSSMHPQRIFSLPKRPSELLSDDEKCIIVFDDILILFYENGTTKELRIPEKPIVVVSYPEFKSIYLLLKSSQLFSLNIETQCLKYINENVSNFFVDTNSGMLIIQQGLLFSISTIGSNSFTSITETSDVLFGLFARNSMMAFFKLNSLPSLQFNTIPYIEFSLISQYSDFESALQLLSSLKGTPTFTSTLRRIGLNSLRKHKGNKFVELLYSFPDFFDEVLVFSLRSVESPERTEVFRSIGPPSALFTSILKSRVTVSSHGLYSFSSSSDIDQKSIMTSSLLLPIIMEEEGPLVAFPASVYVLSLLYFSVDALESLSRFMDPVLVSPTVLPNGSYDCVGIIIDSYNYNEIKKMLYLTTNLCLIKLLHGYQPHTAIFLSHCFRCNFLEFLQSNIHLDTKFTLLSLLQNLGPLYTNAVMSHVTKIQLRNAMIQSQWIVWSVALLILGNEIKEATTILHQYPRLRNQLKGTEWGCLIEQ